MTIPLVLIGGGGHAKVVLEACRAGGMVVRGVADPAGPNCDAVRAGARLIGDDEAVLAMPRDGVRLLIAVGSIAATDVRRRLYEKFVAAGFAFATVAHPSAIIAGDAEIGPGSQVMAGVVIQPGCRIGANVILNTRASIDHDCRIGDHAHIAPGVTFSGGVEVGAGTHVGIGCTAIQNVRIGARTTVGAGSVVLRDIADGVRVAGVPARPIGGSR